MVYAPSSLLSAPSPMTGIATSTCPRGKPPSLVTFPVMVTGSWAGALDTTSRAKATAANTLRTMRRMMGPPGTAGNGRTASLPPRYEAVPGGATEMRRAARGATTGAHKTKTRCGCTGFGRSARVAVSTRRTILTSHSRRRARSHASRERGLDQAQHDERRMGRAKPRARRDKPLISERATEPAFEVVAVAARQLERGAVVQDHHVLSAKEGLELLDLLEVHDGRAVDPDEAGRVELTLEVLHGLAQQVPGLADVDSHVVPFRVDPFDFAHRQQGYLAARLDEQAVEVRRPDRPRRLSVTQEGRQLLRQFPQTALTHLQLGALQ